MKEKKCQGYNIKRAKDYLFLHLSIFLFSFTGVFSKIASVQYNRRGFKNPLLYLFLVLMLANCGIYAIVWQKILKKFELSIAYVNKSIYLIWAQLWAVVIFNENLTRNNVIGLFIVLIGVLVVQSYE